MSRYIICGECGCPYKGQTLDVYRIKAGHCECDEE